MWRACLACLAGLAWLGYLSACTSNAPGEPRVPPVKARDQLRVMSYNVNFGIAGDASTVEAIAGVVPDVVLLQETNARWQQVLLARFAVDYPHHRFADPPDWPAGGMGLLSKHPVIALEQLPSVGGPFFAWRIVHATNLGRVQLLNVHL